MAATKAQRVRIFFLLGVLGVLGFIALPKAPPPPVDPKTENVLPTSKRLKGTQWATVNAFPKLRFTEPMAVAVAGHKMFVLERRGTVQFFDTRYADEKKQILDLSATTTTGLSVEDGALGMTVHPKFAENGYLYVFRTGLIGPDLKQRTNTLSRYTVVDDAIDMATEQVLIEQKDDHRWHNAGCLVFGPDGFLYVSMGDEGGSADQFRNSQTISKDLYSGVLRIDVDQRGGSISHPPKRQPETGRTAHYFIPSDNPFVGEPGVLEEFYALGMRNPHRMSFDSETGRLWLGDVGDAWREEVNLVVPGGNYGWCYDEGNVPYRKSRLDGKPGGYVGTEQEAVYSYPHKDLNYAVIGGYVYRGLRYPELVGQYIYGDNSSGRIWALEVDDDGKAVANTRLVSLTWQGYSGLSSFGLDAEGELLLVVLGQAGVESGRILRLVDGSEMRPDLPVRLSETGLFADLGSLQPAEGVVPYDVNVPFWSDGAGKQRWMALPGRANHNFAQASGGGAIHARADGWSFPDGTVFVKHFEKDGARLETRVLQLHEQLGFVAATYVWDGDDAVLSHEPKSVHGWTTLATQDCGVCHNENAGFVLGVNAQQLNRDDQLARLTKLGMFATPPDGPQPRLVAPDSDAPLEQRVRSYLDANCAQCHRPGGVLAGFDARFATPLDKQNLIRGAVQHHRDDMPRVKKLIEPKRPDRSMILQRLATNEKRMPPLGVDVHDERAIAMLREWIESLPKK